MSFNLNERRITLRLLAYWEKIRDGRPMPCEQDINPDDISDLWDSCFLIHVEDLNKEGYNYAYLGEAINRAYRHGLSKDDPNGMISPNANSIAHSYSRVIESAKPLLEEDEFINASGETIKYRQCLLPLGEGGKVEAIFGGINFKIFPHH